MGCNMLGDGAGRPRGAGTQRTGHLERRPPASWKGVRTGSNWSWIGMDIAGLKPAERGVAGVVEMMLDAKRG